MIDITHIIKNVNQRYEGDLKHYMRLVMKAPNIHAPYHNFRHMTHVFWEAYDGGIHMGLNRRELRNLLIASLMHDYGHAGVKGDDQLNIDRAIRALDKYALEEDREHLLDIRDSIRATKFPYGDEVFTTNQLILRDADQSQTFSLVWMQSLLGLSQEMNMTFEDMLRMQRPFMEGLKFHTLWGQNKFTPLIPMHIARVDNFLSAIE